MFKRLSRKNQRTNRRPANIKGRSPHSLPLMWEGHLEDRRLLAAQITLTAANEILYQASNSDNSLTLDIVAGNYLFSDPTEVINVTIQPGSTLAAINAGTNDVTIVNALLTTSIDIHMGGGSDFVTVRSIDSPTVIDGGGDTIDEIYVSSIANTISNISAPLELRGASGVAIDDSGFALNTTYDFSTAGGLGLLDVPGVPTISWTGTVSYVQMFGGSGANATNVLGTLDGIEMQVILGAGNDTVAIEATGLGSSLLLLTEGFAPDTVTVGSAANGVSDVHGVVELLDFVDLTTVTVDDSANASGRFWVLDQAPSGLGTISWGTNGVVTYGTGIADVTIQMGSGSDDATVLDLGTFTPGVNIRSGAGDDRVYVWTTPAGSNLLIDTEAGFGDFVSIGSPVVGVSDIFGLVHVIDTVDESAGSTAVRSPTASASRRSNCSQAPATTGSTFMRPVLSRAT